jgi:D-xylose 1-dehydrogenase
MSYARYPSLENIVVFVTGGASGIGEYMVRAFAEQRARVGFVDIATEPGRALAEELRAARRSASSPATCAKSALCRRRLPL